MCGESFGTGSHPGKGWALGSAVLAEYFSSATTAVEQIVREHWQTYGRNYYPAMIMKV